MKRRAMHEWKWKDANNITLKNKENQSKTKKTNTNKIYTDDFIPKSHLCTVITSQLLSLSQHHLLAILEHLLLFCLTAIHFPHCIQRDRL